MGRSAHSPRSALKTTAVLGVHAVAHACVFAGSSAQRTDEVART